MREVGNGNRYVAGDYYHECERCGFQMLRHRELVREQHTGLLVCRKCLDPLPRSMRRRRRPRGEGTTRRR